MKPELTKNIQSIFLLVSLWAAGGVIKGQAPKDAPSFTLENLSFYSERESSSQLLSYPFNSITDLSFSSIPSPNFQQPASGRPHTPVSPHFLPTYAQQNPSGYSYLCHVELDIEEALPVPMWVRAGKINDWEYYNSQALYFQVKLLGFKK